MALLLERLIGVRQQAVAVADVGVMASAAGSDDRKTEIGVLADGVAGQPPAMSIAARRSGTWCRAR